MGAKYLYRMDDITPNMNWKQFWKYINLFKNYGVKPLLGIVPNNQDPKLEIGENNKDYWKIIRELKEQGIIEIAQHGYQHKLTYMNPRNCLRITGGSRTLSEFAELSYDIQYRKIKEGQDILKREGLYTDIWMAPCHTFDSVTLMVLNDLGFKKITDGISLFPFYINGMFFIPQQLWRPKFFPAGVFTICLHANTSGDEMYRKVEKHLKSCAEVVSFSQIGKMHSGILCNLLNILFRVSYTLLKEVRCYLRVFKKVDSKRNK